MKASCGNVSRDGGAEGGEGKPKRAVVVLRQADVCGTDWSGITQVLQ